MRYPFVVLLWLPLVTGLLGCATCELVEAELRQKTDQLQHLEQQLVQRDAEIESLRLTLQAYQQELEPGVPNDSSAMAYQKAAISRVAFGRLTGGRDADRDGFHEALLVVVSCFDYDGDVFKCPGTLEITVTEIGKPAGHPPVGQWSFTDSQLRETWQSTLVSQGYQLTLPWQRAPMSSPLRVHAVFTTLEGKRFELNKEIEIKPAPANAGWSPGLPGELPDELIDEVSQKPVSTPSDMSPRFSAPPIVRRDVRQTLVADSLFADFDPPPAATNRDPMPVSRTPAPQPVQVAKATMPEGTRPASTAILPAQKLQPVDEEEGSAAMLAPPVPVRLTGGDW